MAGPGRTRPRRTTPNRPRLMLYATRGLLEFARGRHAEAAAAYRDAERMERLLVMPHMFTARVQALKLQMLVRVGETEQVERALDEMDEEVRETSQMRVVLAALRLARDDPEAAVDILAPLLEATRPRSRRPSVGNPGVAAGGDRARRASAIPARRRARSSARSTLAEPDGLLLPFLLYPTAELLRAPGATSDHSRLADRRDPEPALRTHSGGPARGRRTAPGTPLRERAARAALPADQPPRRRKSRRSCSCR